MSLIQRFFIEFFKYLIDATIPEIGFSTIVPSVQVRIDYIELDLIYFLYLGIPVHMFYIFVSQGSGYNYKTAPAPEIEKKAGSGSTEIYARKA